MASDPEENLKRLGYALPPVPDKAGLYKLVNVVGDRCVVCGHGPFGRQDDGTFALRRGRVGLSVSVEQAKDAARTTAICMLASLRAELGSLRRVRRLVRTLGLVNAEQSCVEHIPSIIDGFSEVMAEVFGKEVGVGARSAVGAGSLPFNIPVEVEAEFELHEHDRETDAVESHKKTTAIAADGHIYQRMFGLPSVINCIGSLTSLGGSRMPPTVSQAMVEASKHFVDLNALQRACGKRIAELCRCPPGYGAFLTTGAAAGLAVSTAACIAGSNSDIIHRLPRTLPTDKSIVIMDRGTDTRWAQSVMTTGASVQFLGTPRRPMTYHQLDCELSGENKGRHACIVFYDQILPAGQVLSMDSVLELSKMYGVPVVVDAAAQNPPRSNLWYWTHLGVDAVIFSGGKRLSGPQTSGMVLARRDLIDSMRLNTSPNELTVCRPMKCSKEDMVGLVAAVEYYMEGSEEEEFAHYDNVLSTVMHSVEGTPGVARVYRVDRSDGAVQPSCIPRLYIDLQPGPKFSKPAGGAEGKDGFMKDDVDHGNPFKLQASTAPKSLVRRLASGTPCIAVNTSDKGVIINPQWLTAREGKVVGRRLAEECGRMVKAGELAQDTTRSKL